MRSWLNVKMQNTENAIEKKLLLFAVCASFLLSFWADYQESVINPDGICYLLSAQMYSTSWQNAMHLCQQAHWPLYSFLIFLLSSVTHTSLLFSANILNAFCSALTVSFFIFICKELGGDRRSQWLAACVILLAHQFNGLRESIIRDHAYWAFYLAACYFLLRYWHFPRFTTAIYFSASLLLATLFRVEGFFFLLILPFLSLLDKRFLWQQRLKHFLSLQFLLISMIILITLWFVIHPHFSVNQLGRVNEVIQRVQSSFHFMIERFWQMHGALQHYVLPSEAHRDTTLVLLLLFIGWYTLLLINNVSWVYAALIFYAWYNSRIRFSPEARIVLAGFILINILITFAFFTQLLFLSNRYLIALSLIFMFWVPFALNDLYTHIEQKKYFYAWSLSLFFIFIFSLGGVFNFGHSKLYIAQAGQWLEKNIPTHASLYVNDFQLMYYSKHFSYSIFDNMLAAHKLDKLRGNQWQQYDYLALQIGKHETQTRNWVTTMRLPVIKKFANSSGDTILILKNDKVRGSL